MDPDAGYWSGFGDVVHVVTGKPRSLGDVVDVSCSDVGTALHVAVATGDGRVWQARRFHADGTWSRFIDIEFIEGEGVRVGRDIGTIRRMAVAPAGQGQSHACAITSNGRANGYLETLFLPGRHFSGPDDFNTQLQTWLKVANRRVHRTLGARPADRWEADRAQMLTLPAVDPPTWWRFSTRLGRDHYVRVDTCDYSVDPAAIGHQVTVLTDNEQVIVLTSGGEIVAQHARCWARHQTLTDPEHAEAGQAMRQEAPRTAPARPPRGDAAHRRRTGAVNLVASGEPSLVRDCRCREGPVRRGGRGRRPAPERGRRRGFTARGRSLLLDPAFSRRQRPLR
ncbi:hypothetical protein [Streptomyces sp. NPDC058678]|uniref:Mu transposase domain-containing protein n=1 Tax=Streptomyces sp. NPDC058678 TaxID=3346595 RepID=UPI00364C6423